QVLVPLPKKTTPSGVVFFGRGKNLIALKRNRLRTLYCYRQKTVECKENNRYYFADNCACRERCPQRSATKTGPRWTGFVFLRNAVGGVPYISVLPLMAVKFYLYPVIGKICQILAQYDII
ncbi:MAG: hypothetical protein J6B67_03735, partial [Oscillospiraceae bacterium]|nr:hypothetical protein [Oscillospiraceae bacterium]